MLKKILKKEYIAPVAVLTVICLVVAGLLGAVNALTSKVIRDAEMKAVNESLADIMPGADLGDPSVPEGAPDTVVAVYVDRGGLGYAVLLETSKGYTGKHNLQGAGANFIPKTLDLSVVDEVIAVCEEDAYKAGRELARLEGLLVGITSGAALHAAKSISEREEYSGKNIVVLLPDTGTRYLSTEMFN